MAMIAVVGAASYEGRQMLLSLSDRGLPYVGFADHGSDVDAKIEHVDLTDAKALRAAFDRRDVTDVIHLPERGTVAKSLKDPLDAFERTLCPLMACLRAAAEGTPERFVFSSTASVYGTPENIPVPETAALRPISPLGAATAAAERMVGEVCRGQNMPSAILRYFNAAGADPDGRAGEADAPKHLITAAVRIAIGRRKGPLIIYGNDYNTPDGTPIRDYVHVADVADAHIDAVEYLRGGGSSVVLNCGYGEGASVQDVIQSVERVTGKPLEVRVEGRREGDPAQLIADTASIRSILGWRPRYNDLDLIIRTAIDWEKKHGTHGDDAS
ncbi:UDP-glucose 4-epimerase GalE [Parvularcula lutaonensis]|uniref:UDP-glucose 4-epimerase n=1 Tax=Parvularcula lutaonensis TaxID=491923 RepID=A0ABV7MAK8_9PROT|nr:UDP-glucose 4-epimerase GalE [Parvularcula lutaonensis]GGY36323.1 UDP-glucose 4-epimerase GalE [Parvularcula lutaonensis]